MKDWLHQLEWENNLLRKVADAFDQDYSRWKKIPTAELEIETREKLCAIADVRRHLGEWE